MAGDSHDVLVRALRDDPALLASLLETLTGRALPGPLEPLDSTVRFSRSAEVRPDVVARSGDTWVACEVQNRIDMPKGRRWLLAVAALHDGTRQMGELVVITASPSVAEWARQVAHVTGPVGTSLRLSPVILLLDTSLTDKLIDPLQPELALCAAWAMQRRHGDAAQRVVERAVGVTEVLPEPLRTAQLHAIFSVLSKQLRTRLERQMINLDNIPESRAHRRLRLLIESHGRVKAQADDVLLVLEQRGLTVTEEERARIKECRDSAQLESWLRSAVTASSVAEVLATKPSASVARRSRAARRSAPAAARPARSSSSPGRKGSRK